VADRYGEGGVVRELEEEVAGLLGMPSALFLPSGTMGQQRRFAFTPTAGDAASSSSIPRAICAGTRGRPWSGRMD
jgi:hypothetical protein